MSDFRLVGRVTCMDGVTRDVFEDADGRQWAIDELGRFFRVWMPKGNQQAPRAAPEERITHVPHPTGIASTPPAAVPPAASQQPIAGKGSIAAQPMALRWQAGVVIASLVAFVLLAVAFGQQGRSQNDSEQQHAANPPSRRFDLPSPQVAPQTNLKPGSAAKAQPELDKAFNLTAGGSARASSQKPAGTANRPADRVNGEPPSRSSIPPGEEQSSRVPANDGRVKGASSQAVAGQPPSGTTGWVDYSRYYDPTYRPAVGEHWVNGYYRSNGTYVRGHYQTNPDDSFYNNWSTKGNVNPHTGKPGTKTAPSSSGYHRRR